jgi:hypothetical protein
MWGTTEGTGMSDHNGVLMMQRLVLAGSIGMAMAQRAAAILDLDSRRGDPRDGQGTEAAVLRVILDAANECLGHFDDRPPGERWSDALLHLLDLAAFAADVG